MNDLQKHFLAESINKLTLLRRDISDEFSEETRSEAFRTFHTIKGTAQTFGLSAAGTLAHTLENLLADGKNNSISSEDLQKILPEGIEILVNSLEKTDFQIPEHFKSKLVKFTAALETTNSQHDFSKSIPDEFSVLLSAQEKASLNDSATSGNHFFVLEIGFETNNFGENFKSFREELSKKGKIIAALPSRKFASEGKIGFQIVFAASEDFEEINDKFPVDIVYQNLRNVSFNLSNVLSHVAAHGKTAAEKLGKIVEFEFDIKAESVSDEHLKIIFDTFIHLVRNAVDHAVEKTGKITLGVKRTKNALLLTVSDDGKGLDLEKIKSKAAVKNLIESDEILSETEISNLVFLPEFSTAENITEISGRGVGLDAVKNTVENAGGQIGIKSESGRGTSFEIFLPLQT
ncbi:MAG TPA: ATP-binding protein [Pyrinomonadaceae bacterium]|jgi:chemotaxis protein histidine kinase CheA